jgi:hypothetical protein
LRCWNSYNHSPALVKAGRGLPPRNLP